MKSISFRDLLVCDELKHIPNEVVLMHPSNDDLVKSILVQIGFDVKREILYEVAKHRDLRGHVAVGVIACGEYSTDSKYKQFLDTTDRVVLAGMRDASLGRELALSMGTQATYKNDEDKWDDGSRAKKDDPRYYTDSELLEMGWTTGEEDDGESTEYIESDWEDTLRAIKTLEETRDDIRKGV